MNTNGFYMQKGWATGYLGFPQKEKAARETERIVKEAEANGFEYKRLFIAPDAPEELDAGSRSEVSIITDNSIDRDSEVVLPSGAEIAAFQKNPVITWGHQYDQPPVGKALWLKAQPNTRNAERIKAKIHYPSKPENWDDKWFPDYVWAMIQAGCLKGKSIGFIPLDARPPSTKEIEARPELAAAKAVFPRWSLIEVAVATVPCNTNALVESIAKGSIELPDWMQKQLGLGDEYLMMPDGKSCFEWFDEPPQPKVSVSWKDIAARLHR